MKPWNMRLRRHAWLLACLACLPLALTAAEDDHEGHDDHDHGSEEAIDATRAANTIILDEIAEANLGIETVEVLETDFETTVFAIGRIEEIPENHAVLSSRIAGRVTELKAFIGDEVKKGEVLAVVESRQPGNPPPSVPLKAPQDGLITESHIKVGEPVEPERELLDISDRTQVWAVAKIPEQEVSTMAKGTKARIRVPALGEATFKATLLRYGVAADRASGTVDGIFVLDNPEGKLVPGMRAEFSIITKSRDWVMAVPRKAIQGDPAKRVVFVRDFELPHAFVRAPVQLGEQNEEFVEIINGLFPGDEVVTKGSYSLAFAGSGSGMSLKEALDAAHGHEHNDDGSEMPPDQKAAQAAEGAGGGSSGSGGPMNLFLLIYAGVVTLVALGMGQMLLKKRGSSAASTA